MVDLSIIVVLYIGRVTQRHYSNYYTGGLRCLSSFEFSKSNEFMPKTCTVYPLEKYMYKKSDKQVMPFFSCCSVFNTFCNWFYRAQLLRSYCIFSGVYVSFHGFCSEFLICIHLYITEPKINSYLCFQLVGEPNFKTCML